MLCVKKGQTFAVQDDLVSQTQLAILHFLRYEEESSIRLLRKVLI